jgi:hypothetical protein
MRNICLILLSVLVISSCTSEIASGIFCPIHDTGFEKKEFVWGEPSEDPEYYAKHNLIAGGCIVPIDAPKYGYVCPVDKDVYYLDSKGKLKKFRNIFNEGVPGAEFLSLKQLAEDLDKFVLPPKGSTRKSVEEVYGEPSHRPTPQYNIYSLNDGRYHLDVQYDNDVVVYAILPSFPTPAGSPEELKSQYEESINAISAVRANYLEKLKKAEWNRKQPKRR